MRGDFEKNQDGNITLFSLLIIPVILGTVTYSIYIGRQVDEKLNLHNASDLSSLAMASQGASGLNMIAANNITIGANTHLISASQMLPRYLSIVRAITSGIQNGNEITTKYLIQNHKSFYSATSKLAQVYGKSSRGLTKMNKAIGSYWVLTAIPKGVQTYRLNSPGSIGLPGRPSHSGSSYYGLKQTSYPDTICHAIGASTEIAAPYRKVSSKLLGR